MMAKIERLRRMDGRPFTLGLKSAELGGYLAVCQGQNGIIHLISQPSTLPI